MAVGGGQPVTGREQDGASLGEGNVLVLDLSAGYTVCFGKIHCALHLRFLYFSECMLVYVKVFVIFSSSQSEI